jgi:DegV family protein with EDD domain
LIKGGRVGLVAGTIGTLMGIVPMISVNDEGRFYTVARTRSYAQAIRKVEDTIREVVKDKIVDLAVVHSNALDRAKELHERIKDIKGLRDLYLCTASPAMGVHAGPGLIGIAYRIIT